MTEYRRILLDGNVIEVDRAGDNLIAGDGRVTAITDAIHLPPIPPARSSSCT